MILQALKLVAKREKAKEENKIFFINYLLKYFINEVKLNYFVLKYYHISSTTFLKKVGFFKKINTISIISFVNYGYNFLKKRRRIKRRLKKRIFRFEGLGL